MNKGIDLPRPMVIFASGERFALTKKSKQPPVDNNRNLLLPSISIRRTDISQSREDRARGTNQSTGFFTIKRKLAPEDRDYQNYLNKLALKNVSTTLTPVQRAPNMAGDSQIANVQRGISDAAEYAEGGLLYTNIGNNIYEFFIIPQPQFFTATYEVIFWTTYTQHMNYLIETFNSAMLPQDRMFKLVTDKGYWFMAYVDDSTTGASNYEDFKDSIRLVKYSLTIKVKGYMLASNGPNSGFVPIRRQVSFPTVSLDVNSYPNNFITGKQQTYNNIPPNAKDDTVTGPLLGMFSLTEEQTQPDPNISQAPTIDDKIVYSKDVYSAGTGRKIRTKYVTKLASNEKSGETTYRASDIETLEEFLKTT